MALDAKKHETLGVGEKPTRAQLAKAILSVNDIVPVANRTEQTQQVQALAGSDLPPGPARPLTTYREDAPGGHRVEYTAGDGVYVPASGVHHFESKAEADAWGDSNPALLTDGDTCIAGTAEYVWRGAWRAAVKHLPNPGAQFTGVEIPKAGMDVLPLFRTGSVEGRPEVLGGVGYMPTIALDFPNGVLSLQLTEIVSDGATKSARGIAFDIFTKSRFRAAYPGDGAAEKRAFAYLAVGY